jgi:uncharacterized membrane protein
MRNVQKRKARIYRIESDQPLSGLQGQQLFVIRGKELTRIETLSDAVFAFTISLLIMSLEVPQTFGELQMTLKSFLPFVATVLLIFLFWFQQYRFFRHYGINDLTIILLNAALLILVLFYVYPLKFLFSLLFGMITGIDFFQKATATGEIVLTAEQFPQLVMVYSAGYAAIWMVFYLMYKYAWKFHNVLQLNAYELADTKKQLRGSLMNLLIGMAAFILGWLNFPALGGICFVMILPILLLNNWYTKKQQKLC